MKETILAVTAVFFGLIGLAQANSLDSLKRITMIQNSYPFPTPDGNSLVFHSNRTGNNEIYLHNISTGEVVQLTSHPDNDRTPSVSPDGRYVAFVSTRDGNYDVFIMDSDGENQVNLTRDKASKDIHPYWSPDGKWIIFNSTNKGSDYDLFIMRPDGTERKKLRRKEGEATHAQFSPDGLQVAFRKFFKTSEEKVNSDIVILDIQSYEETRVTMHKGADGHPVWSPDGMTLVFTSNRDGENEYDVSLYSYDLASKKIECITSHPSDQEDMTPVFTEDGSLYFSRWGFDGTVDIFKMTVN